MPPKKIVIATDYSQQAEVALQHALVLARQFAADLQIVNSVAALSVSPPYPVAAASSYAPQTQELLKLAQGRLDALVEAWAGEGVRVTGRLIVDLPVSGILAAAKEFEAELIVLGTHGRKGVSRFLMGSVAERVAQRAPCDVMVARGAAPTGYLNIIVPTDFSEESEAALGLAHEVAGDGGNVDILHCWQLPAGHVDHWGPPAAGVGSAIKNAASELAQELMTPYVKRAGGIHFRQRLAEPRQGILDELEEHEHDLVVMGAVGHGRVERWLLGSVAQATIRHAPSSVYIVRPKDRQPE